MVQCTYKVKSLQQTTFLYKLLFEAYLLLSTWIRFFMRIFVAQKFYAFQQQASKLKITYIEKREFEEMKWNQRISTRAKCSGGVSFKIGTQSRMCLSRHMMKFMCKRSLQQVQHRFGEMQPKPYRGWFTPSGILNKDVPWYYYDANEWMEMKKICG